MSNAKRIFAREMAKLLDEHNRNVDYLRAQYHETSDSFSFSDVMLPNDLPLPETPDQNNLTISHSSPIISHHSDENDSSEYDEDFESDVDGRSDFVIGIAKWVSESNIAREKVNSLLRFLHENGHPDLPKDVCTLLQTPLQKIQVKCVAPGLYYHFGIQNHFNDKSYAFLNAPCTKVEIDIGIDGAKVFTSSRINIWPIIGAFVDKPNVRPFLIGCYTGKASPKDANLFLKDFCDEIKHLTNTGGIKTKNNHNKIPLIIRCICGDAPARAFLSGIMYHNAKHGCPKCDAVGECSPKSIFRGNPRTDETFALRLHQEHHNPKFVSTKTALEEIGIQMVTQMPLDPMHLVDLGVTKKCIQLFLEKVVSDVNVEEISKCLEEVIKLNTPQEFERTCRPIEDVALWKATEFRQFLLYSSIVALKDNVNESVYYHWLLLVCAIRMLLSHGSANNSTTANQLLEEFVKHYPAIYGFPNVSYNVHGLLHLADDVKVYGVLDSYSCYKFENYIGILKKEVHKPGQVLQQIFRRHYEYEQLVHEKKKTVFGELVLSSKPKDNVCLVKDPKRNRCIPIKILENKNNNIITGVLCLNLNPFFTEPINSANALGIIQYSGVSEDIEVFKYSDVQYKYFSIPYKGSFVLIPILHQTFAKFSKTM